MPYLVFERNSTTAMEWRRGCRTASTNTPSRSSCATAPTIIAAACASNTTAGTSPWSRAERHIRTTTRPASTALNYGDRTTPVLGGTRYSMRLTQTYGIRGSSLYTRVLGTASPFSLDEPVRPVSAQRCEDATRGTSTSPAATSRCSARCCCTAGNTIWVPAPPARRTRWSTRALEFRPFRRLRIIESFTTNRYNATGDGALTEQSLFTPGSSLPALVSALSTPQVVNTNQQQLDGILDVTSKITVRGGWRHVWGDATVRAGSLDPNGPLGLRPIEAQCGAGRGDDPAMAETLVERGLRRGEDGIRTFSAPASTTTIRCGRGRATRRCESLCFQANFRFLDNQNPTAGVKYDLRSRDNSLAAYWTPGGGKRFSVMAEYDRYTMSSSIKYLLLPFYVPTIGNTATTRTRQARPWTSCCRRS